MRLRVSFCATSLVLAFLPGIAHAHLVSTRFGEFYSGLLHPTTTLMHTIPWLALGLLAGFQPLEVARKLLGVFPVAVVCGALLGSQFSNPLDLTYLNVISMLVIGAGVIWARNLPANVTIGLASFFGLTHGIANANLELSGFAHGLYLGGVMLAAYLIICLTSAGTVLLVDKYVWGKTSVRVAGSWILAIGIIYSGFSFLSLQL